jgi:hypothetical protein
MYEDDAELRATLARVVLTDLRSGRPRLTPSAVAALRLLAAPEEALPPVARARRRVRPPMAAVAAGVGVLALTGGLVLVGAAHDSPSPRPPTVVAAPGTPLPSALPAPWSRRSGPVVTPVPVPGTEDAARGPASPDGAPRSSAAGSTAGQPATWAGSFPRTAALPASSEAGALRVGVLAPAAPVPRAPAVTEIPTAPARPASGPAPTTTAAPTTTPPAPTTAPAPRSTPRVPTTTPAETTAPVGPTVPATPSAPTPATPAARTSAPPPASPAARSSAAPSPAPRREDGAAAAVPDDGRGRTDQDRRRPDRAPGGHR